MKMPKFLLATVFIMVLFSCNNTYVFQQYQEIKDEKWHFKDDYYFKFDIKNTDIPYNIYFYLRNNGSYKASNIWVNFRKKSPERIESSKIYEFTLASQDGSWTGNGLGDVINHKFIIDQNIKFDQPGTYTIFVNHEMRDDIVENIINIGIGVEKVENLEH